MSIDPQTDHGTEPDDPIGIIGEATTDPGEEPVPHVPFDEAVRIIEAMLFASDAPLTRKDMAAQIGEVIDPVIAHLTERYAMSGVNLVPLADGYALRTAPDLSYLFEEQATEPKKLSRAALETLAIIAYHQPVTRAEIEEIRGVSAYKGTLDVLLETGWIRMRGRRRTPGRPVTYGTTPEFLDQFTLASVGDLPGLDELKGAGMLEAIPQGAMSAMPKDHADELTADEDPLDDDEAQAERTAMALWPQEDVADRDQDDPDQEADHRG